MKKKLIKFFDKIDKKWSDPVWSKVIAQTIIYSVSAIFLSIAGFFIYKEDKNEVSTEKKTLINKISINDTTQKHSEKILIQTQNVNILDKEIVELPKRSLTKNMVEKKIQKTIETYPENLQLIEILNFRANEINKELQNYYNVIDVKKYLEEFNRLHKLHINALKNNNQVLANEMIGKIHDLSKDIESSDFWKGIRRSRGRISYNIRLTPYSFENSSLITKYIVNNFQDTLNLYPIQIRTLKQTKTMITGWENRKGRSDKVIERIYNNFDSTHCLTLYRLILATNN